MKQTCAHCGSPLPDSGGVDGYCCMGCATVARLLNAGGLDRFYQLRNTEPMPVALPSRPSEMAWLDAPLADALAHARGGLVQLTVDVQGVRCSACVWLIGELFKRREGSVEALVDPSVGRITLTFQPGMDIKAYLRELESFGYGTGPRLKEESSPADKLLARMGVSVALTMNAMMFSAAHYLGLSPAEPAAFHLMRALNVIFAVAVLAVGGSLFLSAAWQGLRRGLLSFDLPIALGIVLGFAGSILVMIHDPTTFSYFDSLNIFTTLMLVGRWLQRRVLEQNQRRLLADDGIDGLYARRLEDQCVVTVPAAHVQQRDVLLVPAGDLLVCPGTLLEDSASFSLDWVNGESLPRTYTRGEVIPAGAFNAQDKPARVECSTAFSSSALFTLLGRSDPDAHSSDQPVWLHNLSTWYVPAVLALASLGFLAWWPTSLTDGFRVATAILVVTCPCALGLAIPLAGQLTASALKRYGLFICRGGFLERATRVRRLLFDKTGTLTRGTLRLANPEALQQLEPAILHVVYTMVSSSMHPRSRCIQQALTGKDACFQADLTVTEQPGAGLITTLPGGSTIRVGSPSFVSPGTPDVDQQVWIGVDDAVCARLRMEEELRADAVRDVSTLTAQGYGIGILSGDAQARVDEVAARLGIPAQAAVGSLSPEGKAAWMREHQARADTLFIGDGINDQPAFAEALCTGTPTVDRPTLAARADFYFMTPGITCVVRALESALRLKQTTRAILTLALTYNVLALSACLMGWMGPVVAALAMPSSSITILLYTIHACRLPTTQDRAATLPTPSHAPVTA